MFLLCQPEKPFRHRIGDHNCRGRQGVRHGSPIGGCQIGGALQHNVGHDSGPIQERLAHGTTAAGSDVQSIDGLQTALDRNAEGEDARVVFIVRRIQGCGDAVGRITVEGIVTDNGSNITKALKDSIVQFDPATQSEDTPW